LRKINNSNKADIFSLGLILLLLFHPMSTYMEQSRIINESKEGKIPTELELELPEISIIIKKMLAINPNDRPSLDFISQGLKLPLDMYTELSGGLYTKKENSGSWRKKQFPLKTLFNIFYRHFKLMGGKLFIFNQKEDKKAETVYDLSEWKVEMKKSENENSLNKCTNDQTLKQEDNSSLGYIRNEDIGNKGFQHEKKNDVIFIENPFQLGCAFKGENVSETLELYEKLNKSVQT